jgi:predicted cupin superfamily sugar epimerase
VEAVSDARVRTLVETLGLVPHPEGGYYGETYRSRTSVRPADDRGERRALTTIYFLLPEGVRSRWHRVSSDEVWHFFEGAPIELLIGSVRLKDRRRQYGSFQRGIGRRPDPLAATRSWAAPSDLASSSRTSR